MWPERTGECTQGARSEKAPMMQGGELGGEGKTQQQQQIGSTQSKNRCWVFQAHLRAEKGPWHNVSFLQGKADGCIFEALWFPL